MSTPLLISASDGARATIHSLGAQVGSWIPAGGAEQLFTASHAPVGQKTFKGGIPVCFPQFASQGPLPAHGFARDQEWTRGEQGTSGTDAWCTFTLATAGELASRWPHKFQLTLKIVVGGARLGCELTVHNPAARAWFFTGALHSYFLVDDIARTGIEGLAGIDYLDKTRDNARQRENDVLRITGETDRVYLGASRPVVLDDGRRRLRVAARGFPDVVVWNPWQGAATKFPQLGPDDYRRFVCVEAAVSGSAVSLEEGESWTGAQEITAL